MPLKVSSQGWVKVAPPPRPPPRKRQVDPEEQKESFCNQLRYFACQGLDPSRERLRLLGNRGEFNYSESDLLRPHSRLERTSTLDQWRYDVPPSRSSSRQSGNFLENDSPPRHMTGDSEGRERRRGSNEEVFHESASRAGQTTSSRRRDRTASAPVIITASPSPSVADYAQSYNEEDVEVEEYPDHVSVARSETPSERHCKHHHRHSKAKKAPSIIPEEEEPDSVSTISGPTRSEILRLRHSYGDVGQEVRIPAPPPSIARSDTLKSRRTDLNVAALAPIPEALPAPIVEREPEQKAEPDLKAAEPKKEPEKEPELKTIVTPIPDSLPIAGSNPAPARSVISEASSHSSRSSKSSRSSRSSKSSRSERSSTTYSSQRSESDTESSYTASTRSASPVRVRARDRAREPDRNLRKEKIHYYKEEDDESEYASTYLPSPSSSPPPISRKLRYDSLTQTSEGAALRSYRDRSVTAPVTSYRPSTSVPAPKPAPSTSTWSSSLSSLSSSSSRSGSSAPSIDGYQFQAAIFQPKSNYRGYRAPSLSKGNRWETATSALSFD